MPADMLEATETELMARLAGGDDLALNAIMVRWKDRVAAFLYRMTSQPDTAADLAQETFVKLYQARKRYQPTGKFSTYLFAIAANLGRNHARWKRRHPTVSLGSDDEGRSVLEKLADGGQNPGDAAVSGEVIRAVNAAFQSLPEDLREAMTLFIYEGMGYHEIATVSGCSPKAAETRIYRARQILKEKLKHLHS